MKKIVLSIAAVMAAAAFAPEASAVPVFARQTGMACSACHFQHFPLLNGFGRAFKASAFTMMGAQGKIEGEHLSIPDTLNMGVLTTTMYEKVSGNANGSWNVPASGGELSLFYGGRISEFAGFISELGMAGAAGAAATGAAKLPMLFEVGDSRVGLVMHTSGGQGVSYSFETLNTGAVNTHKMTAVNGGNTNGGHTGVYSAAQFLQTNTAATGVSFVANHSTLGYVNIGKYAMAPVGTPAPVLPFTYARLVGQFDMAGWDMAAGVQSFGGTADPALSTLAAANNRANKAFALAAGQAATTKATVIDFQAQGEVAGMGLGIYASYGTAAATTVAAANMFNFNAQTRSSFNVGAELGVIPGIATVQLALRQGKSGITGISGANLTSNAIQVGGTYELAQNIELSLTHSNQSGGEFGADNAANAVAAYVGKSATTLMMEALF